MLQGGYNDPEKYNPNRSSTPQPQKHPHESLRLLGSPPDLVHISISQLGQSIKVVARTIANHHTALKASTLLKTVCSYRCGLNTQPSLQLNI